MWNNSLLHMYLSYCRAISGKNSDRNVQLLYFYLEFFFNITLLKILNFPLERLSRYCLVLPKCNIVLYVLRKKLQQ